MTEARWERAPSGMAWPPGMNPGYRLLAEGYEINPEEQHFDDGVQALIAAHWMTTVAEIARDVGQGEGQTDQGPNTAHLEVATRAACEAKINAYAAIGVSRDRIDGDAEEQYRLSIVARADAVLVDCPPAPLRVQDATDEQLAFAQVDVMSRAVRKATQQLEGAPKSQKLPTRVAQDWQLMTTRMIARMADAELAHGIETDDLQMAVEVLAQSAEEAIEGREHLLKTTEWPNWQTTEDDNAAIGLTDVHARCAELADADAVDLVFSYRHRGVLINQTLDDPFPGGMSAARANTIMASVRETIEERWIPPEIRPADLWDKYHDLMGAIGAGVHTREAIITELMAQRAQDLDLETGQVQAVVRGMAGHNRHAAQFVERVWVTNGRIRPDEEDALAVIRTATEQGLDPQLQAEIARAMRFSPWELGINSQPPNESAIAELASEMEILERNGAQIWDALGGRHEQ